MILSCGSSTSVVSPLQARSKTRVRSFQPRPTHTTTKSTVQASNQANQAANSSIVHRVPQLLSFFILLVPVFILRLVGLKAFVAASFGELVRFFLRDRAAGFAVAVDGKG